MNDFKDVALCEPVAVVKPLSDTDPLWSAAANATSPVISPARCASAPVLSVHSASCQLINYSLPLIDLPRFYLSDSRSLTLTRVLLVILLFSCILYFYTSFLSSDELLSLPSTPALSPVLLTHVSISSPSSYFSFNPVGYAFLTQTVTLRVDNLQPSPVLNDSLP